MTNHLYYLVAAYSAVWLIVSYYLYVLIRKNRALTRELTRMEERIANLEKTGPKGSG